LNNGQQSIQQLAELRIYDGIPSYDTVRHNADTELDVVTKGLARWVDSPSTRYNQTDINRTGYNDLWYAGGRDGDGNLILRKRVREHIFRL